MKNLKPFPVLSCAILACLLLAGVALGESSTLGGVTVDTQMIPTRMLSQSGVPLPPQFMQMDMAIILVKTTDSRTSAFYVYVEYVHGDQKQANSCWIFRTPTEDSWSVCTLPVNDVHDKITLLRVLEYQSPNQSKEFRF